MHTHTPPHRWSSETRPKTWCSSHRRPSLSQHPPKFVSFKWLDTLRSRTSLLALCFACSALSYALALHTIAKSNSNLQISARARLQFCARGSRSSAHALGARARESEIVSNQLQLYDHSNSRSQGAERQHHNVQWLGFGGDGRADGQMRMTMQLVTRMARRVQQLLLFLQFQRLHLRMRMSIRLLHRSNMGRV